MTTIGQGPHTYRVGLRDVMTGERDAIEARATCVDCACDEAREWLARVAHRRLVVTTCVLLH